MLTREDGAKARGEGGQWAEGASPHMAKTSRPSWPPAHGSPSPAALSHPRASSRCRPPNCRWGRRLFSSFGPFPGDDPIPQFPFSNGFPPYSGQPMGPSRLRAPPASPPWRHASLAWRRSRRVAASAVRLPRPQSTSPCWAGKGRHPWRQLAGGLRGKLSEARPVPAPKPGAPGTRVARAGSAARRRKVPVKGARPARRR